MSLALTAVMAALAAGPSPPPPVPLEPTAKAPIVVAGKPISRGWLRHWATITARSGGETRRKSVRSLAAGYLISSRWIRGEAAERGVVVTRAEVERRFAAQRKESFPRLRPYRRFLRQSGQTRVNLLFRVELDLLSNRLRALATVGATTLEEEQEQLEAFVQEYRRKWRARTMCRPLWVSEDECGDATDPRRQPPDR